MRTSLATETPIQGESLPRDAQEVRFDLAPTNKQKFGLERSWSKKRKMKREIERV